MYLRTGCTFIFSENMHLNIAVNPSTSGEYLNHMILDAVVDWLVLALINHV